MSWPLGSSSQARAITSSSWSVERSTQDGEAAAVANSGELQHTTLSVSMRAASDWLSLWCCLERCEGHHAGPCRPCKALEGAVSKHCTFQGQLDFYLTSSKSALTLSTQPSGCRFDSGANQHKHCTSAATQHSVLEQVQDQPCRYRALTISRRGQRQSCGVVTATSMRPARLCIGNHVKDLCMQRRVVGWHGLPARIQGAFVPSFPCQAVAFGAA